MDLQYSILIKFQALHDYFSDKSCSVLQFIPTSDCNRMLMENGLLFRQTDGAFEIWSNDLLLDKKSAYQNLRKLNDRLSFTIECNDPYFLNYTEAPEEDLKKSIFYFSNLNAKALTVDGNQKCLMSTEKYASAKDKVNFFAKTFIYSSVSSLLEEEVVVTGPDKEKVDPDCIQYVPTVNEYQIDLRDYPDGLYELEMQGKKSKFYISDDFSWSRPFGVIDIYFNELVPSGFELINANGELQSQEYTIRFASRTTYWKYYIMGNHLQKLPKLAISNGKSGAVFSGPVETTLPDETSALMFESVQPIPMREKPSYIFQLESYNTDSNSRKIVVKGLPCPDNILIKKGSINDPSSYISEMFIY